MQDNSNNSHITTFNKNKNKPLIIKALIKQKIQKAKFKPLFFKKNTKIGVHQHHSCYYPSRSVV
ncbi:hypothetical protein BTN98_12935 [Photobacterium aquimaris]|uniref:Uncharacterized protein n=1 Tax=Photobacterium aquimaris TaxID=512643 RepID=A0A2T3I3C3_9GAMM|nr:hypothetical protein AYY21_02615 [Photobacterium aquimaris]PQJ38343.1 hypothetical protein BTN98_12935 [Photobacterium aquimaris]PSU12883.1 hypothetical protein C0W81_00430 [Photobacterium aquimaris]